MAAKKKKSSSTLKIKNANGTTSTFKKDTCGGTKAAAQKRKNSIKSKGNRAVVRKVDGKYCVFKGPKSKTKGRKK